VSPALELGVRWVDGWMDGWMGGMGVPCRARPARISLLIRAPAPPPSQRFVSMQVASQPVGSFGAPFSQGPISLESLHSSATSRDSREEATFSPFMAAFCSPSAATKQQSAGSVTVPQFEPYFRLELTNAAWKSSIPVTKVVQAIGDSLEAAGCSVASFEPSQCKWRCQYLEGPSFVSLRARLYAHENHTILEMLRRDGDSFAFHNIYRRMLAAVQEVHSIPLEGRYRHNLAAPLRDLQLERLEPHLLKPIAVPEVPASFLVPDEDAALDELRGIARQAASPYLDTRCAAAKMLAGALGDPTSLSTMAKMESELGLMAGVVDMLRSSYVPLQRFAVVCAANACQEEALARALYEAGGVKALVDCLSKADVEPGLGRECARAVVNVARRSAALSDPSLMQLLQLPTEAVSDRVLRSRLQELRGIVMTA
jgi:hypothetical protein